MKILVFSDSHRFLSGMVQAIQDEQPDQVIHLGDFMSDAEELAWRFPKLPICMVPGNCDGWNTALPTKRITLQNRSILLSMAIYGMLNRVMSWLLPRLGKLGLTYCFSAIPIGPAVNSWRAVFG